MQNLRNMDLYKPPGIAETLDWTEALVALGAKELDEDLISATLGSVAEVPRRPAADDGQGPEFAQREQAVPETAAPPPMLDAAVTFGRVLRRAGLPAGPDRVVEFVRAVDELDVTRREDVYWAGRVTLCSRPEDMEVYDRAFRLFWDGEEPPRKVSPPKGRLSVTAAEDSVQPPKKTVEKNERGEEAVRLRYSPVDILRKKDFADCTPGGVRRAAPAHGRPEPIRCAAKEPAPRSRAQGPPRRPQDPAGRPAHRR